MHNKEKFYARLILWCAPILFFLWNFIGLEKNCLAGDEPFSFYFAGQSYSKIISELFTGNNPPLYEILLHSFTLIFGHTIFNARLVSLFFITGAVFFTLKTAKEYFGFKHLLLTSLLLFSSNFLTWFSHEIRAYGLLLFLISTANYYFLSAIKTKSKVHFVLLVVLNTLMLYTHYLSVFVIFCQFASLLLYKKERLANLKLYVLYHLAAIVLAFPLLLNLIKRILQTEGGKTWLTPPEGIVDIYNMLWKFCNQPVPTVFVISVFLIGGYRLYNRRHINFTLPYLHLFLGFPLLFLLIFFLSFQVPLFLDRYLSIVVLSFYLFTAHSVVSTFKTKTGFLITTLLIASSFIATKKTFVDNDRHLDELSSEIKSIKKARQKIIVSDLQLLPAMSYYFTPNNFFEQTNEQSEEHQLRSLEQANIYFERSIDLSNKDANQYILIESGVMFTNRDQFSQLKNFDLHVIKVPEIYKIFTFKNENINSETQ